MHQRLSLADFRDRAGPEQALAPDGYDALPMPIQDMVTPKEYAWLSAVEKHRLIQDLTEPEPES